MRLCAPTAHAVGTCSGCMRRDRRAGTSAAIVRCMMSVQGIAGGGESASGLHMRGMNFGTRAALRAVLTCAALGTLPSGCILFYPAPQPPGPPRTLSPEELMGTWRDEAHGRLTFSADGSFTATDVCGDYSTSGDDIVGVEEPLTMTGTGAWGTSTWTPERAHGCRSRLYGLSLPNGSPIMTWAAQSSRSSCVPG